MLKLCFYHDATLTFVLFYMSYLYGSLSHHHICLTQIFSAYLISRLLQQQQMTYTVLANLNIPLVHISLKNYVFAYIFIPSRGGHMSKFCSWWCFDNTCRWKRYDLAVSGISIHPATVSLHYSIYPINSAGISRIL